jgi:hypothetical protein
LAHRRGAKRSTVIVDEAVLRPGSMATIARTATLWAKRGSIESFIKPKPIRGRIASDVG